MDVSLALQYAVIAVAVVVSAWVVLKKQFPGPLRKARVALALPLLRDGRADWVQRVGKWVAPPGFAATGKTCGGCDGCG